MLNDSFNQVHMCCSSVCKYEQFDGHPLEEIVRKTIHEQIKSAEIFSEETTGRVTEDNDMGRIPWDKYEVALLIETYYQIKAGVDRYSALMELSNTLRQLAINRGSEIDDTYRNFAGMTWQYSYIEKAFDKTNYVNHAPSKLFSNMVELSINDPQEFTKILKEAKGLVSIQPSATFLDWISNKSNDSQMPQYKRVNKEIKAQTSKSKVSNSTFIEIGNLKELEKVQQTVESESNCFLLQSPMCSYLKEIATLESKSAINTVLSETVESKLIEQQIQTVNGNADEALARKIYEILVSDFPNGIRHSSVIDHNKLKRIYVNRTGCDFPETIDVQELLKSIGVVSGDKAYILTDEQKTSLCEYIQGLFAQQYKILYYIELLSSNDELFSGCHIEEVQVLRTILETIMPKYYYHETFMLADKDASVASEIEYAYADANVLTYQQLKSRLPFIEFDAIKWTLSASDLFVWTQAETYVLVNKILLDPKDVEYVHTEVLPRIHSEGYVSLNTLSLQESCDLNTEISYMAVRDAMYVKHMASECSRNGVIVTPRGKTLSSYEIVTAFCYSLSSATIGELKIYEEELTGYQNGLSLSCACNSMVRVNQDTFISDECIAFDIDTVDHAISLFVQDRIVPITAINSFTSFPHVEGYEWNLYLVESFLRRFSKRFIIEGGPAQSSYVGVICSRELRFDTYEDKLAAAVIQDGIQLNESDIGYYLISKKYILRRTATIKTVLKKALSIREQRGDGLV